MLDETIFDSGAKDVLLLLALDVFCDSEKDKATVRKTYELCQKHNVSFTKFIDITKGLATWEASRKNV